MPEPIDFSELEREVGEIAEVAATRDADIADLDAQFRAYRDKLDAEEDELRRQLSVLAARRELAAQVVIRKADEIRAEFERAAGFPTTGPLTDEPF